MTAAELIPEGLIALAEAARLFPGARGASRANPSTVYRWCVRGCKTADGRRVHLEHLRAGSRVFTTTAAVARFIDALSAPTDLATAPVVRTPATRRRDSEAAAAALEAAGA